MGYAWSPVFCATTTHAVRVRACAYFLFDFLLVPCDCSSDSRPPAVHVHTAANPYRNGNLLPAECTSDPGHHIWDLSPLRASGTYLSVMCISGAYLFGTRSCNMIYFHREEIPRYISVGIGIGELATKRPRPYRCNRISFVAKTESVLDGGPW